MNYINILIGLVILLILSKIIRNTAEYFKCPNDNDALNKFVRHSFEKRRDSLIKEREDITKTKMDFLESELLRIKKKSYSDMTNWVLNPKNVFIWENIYIDSNKVNIIKPSKYINGKIQSEPISISNIQVWGKIPGSNEPARNWATSSREHGAVIVGLSSKKGSTEKPIYFKNQKAVEGLPSGEKTATTDVQMSSVECPDNFQITSCNCWSDGATCIGAEVEKNGVPAAHPK